MFIMKQEAPYRRAHGQKENGLATPGKPGPAGMEFLSAAVEGLFWNLQTREHVGQTLIHYPEMHVHFLLL